METVIQNGNKEPKKAKTPKKKVTKGAVLSEREKEVLEFAGNGYTTSETAEKLELSFHTVEVYRKNVLGKLNARNMIEAVKIYYTK